MNINKNKNKQEEDNASFDDVYASHEDMAALTPAAPQAAELTDSPNLTRRAPMQPHEHLYIHSLIQLPSSVDVSSQPQPMLMINSKAISSQKQNTNKKSTSNRIGALYRQGRLPSTKTPNNNLHLNLNPNLGASAAAAAPNLQLDLRSLNKSNIDDHQPTGSSVLLIPTLNAYHQNKGMGFGSAQETLKA
jgi:hypothetical protein